jgi:hypothetical protein
MRVLAITKMLLTALVVIVCSVFVAISGDGNNSSTDSLSAAEVESHITAEASDVIALRDRSGRELSLDVEQITVSPTSAPEIDTNLTGTRLWRIETDAILIDLRNWTGQGERSKRFTVYFDSSGRLPLGVFAVCADCDELDSADYWERECLARSWSSDRSVFMTPTNPPQVSFSEALEADPMGSPAEALALSALYVRYDCGGLSVDQAWVIDIVGFSPILARQGSPGYRTWHSVVNAATGDVVFSASSPCATLPVHFRE